MTTPSLRDDRVKVVAAIADRRLQLTGDAGRAVDSFVAGTLVYQLLGPDVIGVIPSSAR